jgi:hypothetical protein
METSLKLGNEEVRSINCECDECPAMKGHSNHWKVIDTRIAGSPTLLKYDDAMAMFISGLIKRTDMWVTCGNVCFQKAMGRWTTDGEQVRKANHVFRTSVSITA